MMQENRCIHSCAAYIEKDLLPMRPCLTAETSFHGHVEIDTYLKSDHD
jgi:hypothetical protein